MQPTDRSPHRHHPAWRAAIATWRMIWPIVRQTLGWICILLGLIGLALPILQGTLLLVIGIALVGRRHWLIRRVGVHLKLLLRRWAASRHPPLAWTGQIALRAQQQSSRQRRRLHWWWRERRRRRARPADDEGAPSLDSRNISYDNKP